jgi:carboxyl-terminal processing protease
MPPSSQTLSQKNSAKKIGAVLLIIALVAISFGIGLHVGSARALASIESQPALPNAMASASTTADFSTFWKVWNLLDENYVPTPDHPNVSDQQKVWGAIEGLAQSYGDPYTVFFPPQENQDFQDEITGDFGGVGMEVGLKDGVITVIAPLKGTPAQLAGIKAGDAILKIGTTSTADLTLDDAINMIRGAVGTSVTVSVLSSGDTEPRSVSMIRTIINAPIVDTKVLPNGVFDINLYEFSENSPQLFENALNQYINSGDHKLIIDLRGDPGGYLEAAVDIGSWFLAKGQVIVTEDTGGHGQNTVYTSQGYAGLDLKDLRMVVLVDDGSASAAEILAGALQEHGVAKLVGTETFGKGSVQELIPVTSDTSLKVTIARWLTPNGTSISDHGLTPDDVVNISQQDVNQGKDPQLDAAEKILNQ